MKRAIALIIITLACIAGFFSVKGALPFIPILGSSMEPELRSGSLLTIEPVNPAGIEVGDVIIYNIPTQVREYYNYPPTIAHRVIEIKTVPSLGFRTAGDNTGEDPFTVRPQDIRGAVGRQILYLGLPLLFFQSLPGVIFIAVALFLLTIFLYGNELSRGGSRIRRGMFAPVINETRKSSRALAGRMESTEKKMDATEKALDRFAGAVGQYAENISSHTAAIRGLAEASQELKQGAAAQNRALANLMESRQRIGADSTTTRRRYVPPAIRPFEGTTPTAGGEKPVDFSRREPSEKPAIPSHEGPKAYPPGCVKNRGERLEKALEAEKKIGATLDRLHERLQYPKRQT